MHDHSGRNKHLGQYRMDHCSPKVFGAGQLLKYENNVLQVFLNQNDQAPHLWWSQQWKCQLKAPWRDWLAFGINLCYRTCKWRPRAQQAKLFHGTTTRGICSASWSFESEQSSGEMRQTSSWVPHHALRFSWENLERSSFHPQAWCLNWSKNNHRNIHNWLKIRFCSDFMIHDFMTLRKIC